MFAKTRLVFDYAIFAFIATVANIGAQDIIIRVYPGDYAITLSVLIGTGVGLVVKYVLDKRFIFRFRARDTKHDAQTFTLYVTMGVLTTAIFWGFEWMFHTIFANKEMRYLGGVMGLAIGYLIKYQLDKRYVFGAGGR
ncbi:MAG: GtrA family protein [Gammaproteobacteria bacterium]|nr:GtrA family protein [Gammaproteobacteria bacterium]